MKRNYIANAAFDEVRKALPLLVSSQGTPTQQNRQNVASQVATVLTTYFDFIDETTPATELEQLATFFEETAKVISDLVPDQCLQVQEQSRNLRERASLLLA